MQKDPRITIVARPGKFVPTSPVPGGIDAGGFIWLSGLIAVDIETGEYSSGDIRTQTNMTFDYIEKTLANAGCSLANVVRVWVYLTCQADFDGMNEVYRERFAAGHYPARSTLIVAGLRVPSLRVEIDVVALKP